MLRQFERKNVCRGSHITLQKKLTLKYHKITYKIARTLFGRLRRDTAILRTSVVNRHTRNIGHGRKISGERFQPPGSPQAHRRLTTGSPPRPSRHTSGRSRGRLLRRTPPPNPARWGPRPRSAGPRWQRLRLRVSVSRVDVVGFASVYTPHYHVNALSMFAPE